MSQAAAFHPWVLVLPPQAWKVVVHPHLANSIHSFSPVPSSLSLLLLQLDLILPVFSSNFSCYQCLVTSLPAGVVNVFHEGTKPRLPRASTHKAVNKFSMSMSHFLRYGPYSLVLQCSGFVAMPVTPAF